MARKISSWQIICLCISALVSMAITAHAQDGQTPRYAAWDISDPGRVDVALVLAVDVSSSIEAHERRFQREAYAAALSDERVAQLALGGGSGRVAIAYMEWSGKRFQRVHLPMRIMSSPQELAAFGAEILAIQDRVNDPMFVQPTAVGNALVAAEAAMAELAVPARDYVIDISGDGVLNDGQAIIEARDHVLSMGLTVNGLPIEVASASTGTTIINYQDVTRYYKDCVIGGPGSFHLVARGFEDIRETLIMKLMLEMADIPSQMKSRIAHAWNQDGASDTARVIPVISLELAPNRPVEDPPMDCD